MLKTRVSKATTIFWAMLGARRTDTDINFITVDSTEFLEKRFLIIFHLILILPFKTLYQN